MSYRDARRPRLFGHRGASIAAPENTMLAFRRALAGGATHLELDVHMSRDGHVVVHHDASLDRTRDLPASLSSHAVKDLDLATLRTLRAKGPMGALDATEIPTLAELLTAFPGVPLNIEVKQADPPMVDAFFDVLDAQQARESVLVAAEDDAIMAAVREKAGGALTGMSSREVLGFVLEGANPDYRPRGFALQVPEAFEGMTIVTPDFIDRAKRLGVEVHVWTVNEPADAARLVALGVDGIMSDCPEVLASALPHLWPR